MPLKAFSVSFLSYLVRVRKFLAKVSWKEAEIICSFFVEFNAETLGLLKVALSALANVFLIFKQIVTSNRLQTV